MDNIQNLDLAILGGGCAGLSLARELALRNVKQSVCVFEPKQEYIDDRSWCFWANGEQRYSKWSSFKWVSWMFGSRGSQQETRQSAGYFYHYIRSIDFYQNSLAELAECPTVQIKLGCTVTEVIEQTNGWLIKTDRHTYLAKQVVDTRPPATHLIQNATLLQSFLGIEIQLPGALQANANAMELMTNMRLVKGAFCFDYILPYTAQHLLVEVTFFSNPPPSREELQAEINSLLHSRGWAGATVLRTEFGMLPMGLSTARVERSASYSRRMVQAGLRAGALRPSSGYGFLRIQRWAEQCAQHYCANETLIPQTTSGFLIRQMDKIFLNVLKEQPTITPTLFNQMLSKTNPERFIRFMDDQARWSDCLQIVLSLPKIPFIKAIFRLVLGK